MRLVRPYSDVGMKGTQIWPYDDVSARTIDEIVKSVVIDANYLNAVSATSDIEFDAFMRMLSRLSQRYSDETYQYILALAEGHDDADLRYNAIQFAVDVFSRRIRHEDYYKLANALDDDSIVAVFGQIIASFIENKLEENSYAYGIGDALDSISSASVVDGISVLSLRVLRNTNGIEFNADLELSVTLNAHDVEASVQDSYPATVKGNLDRSGFHITQASVDTSSFHE